MPIPLIIGNNTVNLTSSEPSVRYSITVTQKTRFFTTGSYDTFCTLFDASLNVVANYDDTSGSTNFDFFITNPGDYFLDVRLYSNSVPNELSFALIVEEIIMISRFDIAAEILPIGFWSGDLVANIGVTGLYDVDIVAAIAELTNIDFVASVGLSTYTRFDFVATVATTANADLSATVGNVRQMLLHSQIGVIETTQAEISAIVAMTSRTQFNLLAPIIITQAALKTVELAAVVRLTNHFDSVVVDIHQPETPKYGTYS